MRRTQTSRKSEPWVKISSMITEIFFRWAAWLLVLAIAVFTLSPIGVRPTTGASELSANLERFAAFAVIGACFGLGYPKHWFTIILLVIGIVGALEVAQNLVPGRHGRLSDGILKAAGALFGLAAAMISQQMKAVP